MSSRRVLKAAEAIREVVAWSIIRDIQDPRVSGVTVTHVEVAGDMQHAKVHVSIMGSEAKQKLCLKGLQNAAGFFQRKIGDRIQTRYTPRLQFVLDKGVKKSIEMARLLREVLPKDETEIPDDVETEVEVENGAEVDAEVTAEAEVAVENEATAETNVAAENDAEARDEAETENAENEDGSESATAE